MGCVTGKHSMLGNRDELPSVPENDPIKGNECLERLETSKLNLEQPKRWGKRPAKLCRPQSKTTPEDQESLPPKGKSKKGVHTDNSQIHTELLAYKGKLPDGTKLLNTPNSKKHQRSLPSRDEQELVNLMKPKSLNDAHLLRKALSDHVEEYEALDQNVDLEKKLSAEIGKEKKVNQTLREFRGGSEARKSERRLSIARDRTSLHVIPEHYDEPANPEIYQYSDTNLYF